MLTPAQDKLWRYIAHCMADGGIAPTFETMASAMGLKSKSGVARLIDALEHRGFLRRLPNKARAIELLRKPADGPIPVGIVKILADGSVEAWFDAARLRPLPYERRAKIYTDITVAFAEQIGCRQ